MEVLQAVQWCSYSCYRERWKKNKNNIRKIMSKAEDRALEAYPSTSHYWNAEPDRNAEAREFYKQGYHQAEKDLDLTWEDISTIRQIMFDYNRTIRNEMPLPSNENYCKEVLKRFKENRY